MSKFWNEASDSEEADLEGDSEEWDEDESGEEGSSDYSDEEDGPGPAKRFEFTDWDSSEEEKRVVKSAAEKLSEQLMEVVEKLRYTQTEGEDFRQLDDEVDVSEWPVVPNFATLKQQVESGMSVIQKYKKEVKKSGVPPFFIKALASVTDSVNVVVDTARADENFKNAIVGSNYRALNAINRWLAKEVSKPFRKQLEAYRKDPSNERYSDPIENSEEELTEEEEQQKQTQFRGVRGTREYWLKRPGEDSSDESTEEEDASFESSGEESDEVDSKRDKKPKPGAKHAGKGKRRNRGDAQQAAAAGKAEAEDEEESENEAAVSTKDAPLEEEKELKEMDVDRLYLEMLSMRGKKVDYRRLLRRLELLLPKAHTTLQRAQLLLLLLNTQFDAAQQYGKSAKARRRLWLKSATRIRELIQLLTEKHEEVALTEDVSKVTLLDYSHITDPESEIDSVTSLGGGDDDEAAAAGSKKHRTSVLKKRQDGSEDGPTLIMGSVYGFLDRLDTVFTTSLQQIDPHTQDYLDRLADDTLFLAVAEETYTFYRSVLHDLPSAARIAVIIMAHLYYKQYNMTAGASAQLGSKGKDAAAEAKTASKPLVRVDFTELLEKYASLIYKHGDSRCSTHAMLMTIYHYALQDNFYEARDRMLMSHLQDNIYHTDIATQILFNRTNVQIGLCAFRQGFIKEAHACLSEIYSGGRVKELLAQGTANQKWQEKDREQEKIEKARMLPYHMHIPLDLLESSHLIAAMLLEVPNMASERFAKTSAERWQNADRSKIVSKYLRKLLDQFERQVFNGPPETTRDFVVAGARALAKGNWKKAVKLLLGLEAWSLLPNPEDVKAMLKKELQQVGLKTYLLTYSPFYESMATKMLSEMFELDENEVHCLVSAMMLTGELKASWNQPTGTIVMHKVELNKLQFVALKYADRISSYLDSNERLLDTRLGSYGYKHDDRKGGRGRDGDDDNRGKRRNYRDGNRGRSGGYRNNRRDNRSDNRRGGYNNRDNRRDNNRGRSGGRGGGRSQGGGNRRDYRGGYNNRNKRY